MPPMTGGGAKVDWKQIAVGTISAVFVSVLSGVMVWQFTKENEKKEGLQYSVSQAGVFGQGPDRLTSYLVTVKNAGSVKAETVSISIRQTNDASLTDAQALWVRPKPSNINLIKTNREYNIKVPTFLTTDRALVSLLYKGDARSPAITIRSKDGIGFPAPVETGGFAKLSKRKIFASLASFAIAVVMSFLMARYIVERVSASKFLVRDRNNSAFMLFHAGLTDVAMDVLTSAIRSGENGPIVLSNLGALYSFYGENDKSKSLIDVSYKWSSDKHTTAVVNFNDFIRLFNSGNKPEAYAHLNTAVGLSKTILAYCNRSVIVQNMSNAEPDLKTLITNLNSK